MKKVLIAISVIFGLWSTSMADEGADLFKKCATCHGAQGEKAALGKSKIIKDMSSAQIVTALKGYKDGSYGREQKAMMKPQVASLSDAQIEELASFITKK